MFNANLKILVVDDFLTMRKVVKKVLTDCGFSAIEEAEDGNVALNKFKEAAASGQPYGLIVSDWNMPNMKGIDLLKAVRAEEVGKNLPFLMVTAESEQKCIIEAIKAGVSDYVIKPFNADTVKQKLARAYAKHNGVKAA